MTVQNAQARSHVATAGDVTAGVVALQFDHIDQKTALFAAIRATNGTFRAFAGAVSVAGGQVLVNSIATPAVAAAGVLTLTAAVNGNTVTIGTTTYTAVTALSTGPTVPYEVLLGGSAAETRANLIAAINGAAGEGTTYSTGTVAHLGVTAAAGAGDAIDITARVAGTAGNSISTVATLSNGSFAAVTLLGGANYVAVVGAVQATDVVSVMAAHG